MKFYGIFREGSKINQLICAILINLPVFAYGASTGWMSPMTLLLQSDHSPKGEPLTDVEVSWIASIPYLVCIPCNYLIAAISDYAGRKVAVILISLANAASWILLLLSLEVWVLIIARALLGITMAGCFVACPMYTKEISDATIRGALGCFLILFQTSGNLFLYVIGDLLSYNLIIWICLTIPIVHIISFIFMPDSPSYLVKKERVQEASKSLAWLRCRTTDDPKVQEELDLIIKEQINDEVEEFSIKTIFTDKILRRAFQIAMIVTLGREVCGALPVLNFAGDIFSLATRDTGLVLSPNQQAMLLGTVQVVGSMLASSVVEKCGRKPLIFITSLISGLTMCTLASWFLMRDQGIEAPSWVPLLTLCLCIFCDASGLQPISIVLAGEIFSFKHRGIVMAITMSCASSSAFLQLLFFKPLANAVGIHVAFYFFGIVCLLLSVYVILVIPETKARCLEDIYKDLLKKDVRSISDKEKASEKKVTRI